jgi:signal peptidase
MRTAIVGAARRLWRIGAGAVTAVGLIAIAISAGAHLGWISPLVVVSGSMEPAISTGDLLVDVRVPVSQLRVGDVVSARPDAGDLPVSHRIVEIQQDGDTAFLRLKGDANASVDAPIYQLSGTAWTPRWRIPGAGWVLTSLVRPSVRYPLIAALIALIVFVRVPGRPRPARSARARHRAEAPADVGRRDGGRAPARASVGTPERIPQEIAT